MTDGERLVWAASFAIAFDRSDDSTHAARSAALAIAKLRDEAARRSAVSNLTIDERDLLDEIVSVP